LVNITVVVAHTYLDASATPKTLKTLRLRCISDTQTERQCHDEDEGLEGAKVTLRGKLVTGNIDLHWKVAVLALLGDANERNCNQQPPKIAPETERLHETAKHKGGSRATTGTSTGPCRRGYIWSLPANMTRAGLGAGR
jgi:hypothetical protein